MDTRPKGQRERPVAGARTWQAPDDPAVEQFVAHLEHERNASVHTLSSYLIDLHQFVGALWGPDALPPFDWGGVDRFAVRRFLADSQKNGSEASTTARKLSSLRSFYRFLEREEVVASTPAVVNGKSRKALINGLTSGPSSNYCSIKARTSEGYVWIDMTL